MTGAEISGRIELPFYERTVPLLIPVIDLQDEAAISSLRENLQALAFSAERYLELFVDRSKASELPDQPWMLEELEFATSASGGLRARFNHTLNGDDGGLWVVEFLTNQMPWRPVRFERQQG